MMYQIETGGHAAQVDEVVESIIRLLAPVFPVFPIHAALAALTEIDPCAWRRHECPGFCDWHGKAG